MAYGKHWEWRGFGYMPNEIIASIRKLPSLYPEGRTDIDEYLWVPGSNISVKLRSTGSGTIKFKRLLREDKERRLQLWEEKQEDEFPFPFTREILLKLGNELKTSFPVTDESIDRAKLLTILKNSQPEIRIINVNKFRVTYKFTQGAVPLLVEVAQITIPESTMSFNIENAEPFTDTASEMEINKVRDEIVQAIQALKLSKLSNQISYVKALDAWGMGSVLGSNYPSPIFQDELEPID